MVLLPDLITESDPAGSGGGGTAAAARRAGRNLLDGPYSARTKRGRK